MLVTPMIVNQNTHLRKSIPAATRLALTLRYLATGDSFQSLEFLFRIPEPTISKIVPEVLDSIYQVLANDYLKASLLFTIESNQHCFNETKFCQQMSTSPDDWEAIASRYEEQWQYPHCIGAIDGRHVVMVAPPNSGSVFYNYKGSHSIILMDIADVH